MPQCNSITLSTYHFPGIADVVGLFSNFSQFVYMPGQWGVHRDCNDLAAQGNAIVAKTAPSISLHTEKAPKEYVHKKILEALKGPAVICLKWTKAYHHMLRKIFCSKRKEHFSFCSVASHSMRSPLAIVWPNINTGTAVLIYCQFKFKLRKTQLNTIWLWGREDGGSKRGAVLTLKLKQNFILDEG